MRIYCVFVAHAQHIDDNVLCTSRVYSEGTRNIFVVMSERKRKLDIDGSGSETRKVRYVLQCIQVWVS